MRKKNNQTDPGPRRQFAARGYTAALLGAMGKGVRKQFSAAERKRRAARMAEARKARWRKPANADISDLPKKG